MDLLKQRQCLCFPGCSGHRPLLAMSVVLWWEGTDHFLWLSELWCHEAFTVWWTRLNGSPHMLVLVRVFVMLQFSARTQGMCGALAGAEIPSHILSHVDCFFYFMSHSVLNWGHSGVYGCVCFGLKQHSQEDSCSSSRWAFVFVLVPFEVFVLCCPCLWGAGVF